MRTVKVNVGAGKFRLPGYVPIDRKLGTEAFPLSTVVDVGSNGLKEECQLEDSVYTIDEVDEIRASHVLEHFQQWEVQAVLQNWHNRLKPGGLLRIAVPDFNKVLSMRDQAEGRTNGHRLWDALEAEKWPLYICGGWLDEDDRHGSIFTEEGLRKRLEMLDMEDISMWDTSNEPDTARHPVTIGIQARRAVKTGRRPVPEGLDGVNAVKTCAIMSVPRLGWQDHFGCALRALSPGRIPIRTFTGAFWEQCMQKALEDCMRDGIDWVLCIDYDSLFTSRDVDALIGYLGENPNIDAIAALQCRRCLPYPLMTIKGSTKVEIGTTPVKVDTAHFGLTLIRMDALRAIKQPWFEGRAGEDGTWSHYTRIDPDISFWYKWREAGKTIYIAPDVRIGHLELMVAQFNDKGEAEHVHVKDWMNATGTVEVF